MGMDGRHSDYRLCEKTLNRIRGVASAKVTIEGSKLTEIHVLANGEREHKLLVRDVQSALFTCHDIHLKPDQIKVLESKETLQFEQGDERVLLLGLNYHLSQGWGRAGVQLEFSGEQFYGMAEGPSTLGNRNRLFAEATLKAVESCLKDKVTLLPEHVSVVDMGFERAMLVAVSVAGAEEEEVLTGSCVVRGDEWEAVVKATLDALNRRFSFIN